MHKRAIRSDFGILEWLHNSRYHGRTEARSMDQLIPALYDNPNPNSPNAAQKTAAEPFRMELAALIGAKLNNNSFLSIASGLSMVV